MSTDKEVEHQLHLIHSQRNKHVWIFHIFLALTSTFFEFQELKKENYWFLSLATIFSGVMLRMMSFRLFNQLDDRKGTPYLVMNYLGMIVLALGWMLHFWAIYSAYGSGSPVTSNTLLFIAVLVSGSTVTLAADRKAFYIFSSIICLVPCLIFFMDTNAHQSVIVYILVFYMFNLFQVNMGCRQLRKSVENELHARNEKDRVLKIINTVPGFVGVLNKNREFTLVNQATLALYPDVLGRRIGGIDPNSNWEQRVMDLMDSDQTSTVTEEQTIKEGKTIHALVNINKTPDGGVIIVSLIINDLVEARRLLKEQEAKTQYVSKLALLGEMAASIAHEINNPLTIIQGSASVIQKLLEREPIDVHTVKVLGNKLMETTDRISKTIRSLKNLSRNSENDPYQTINLESLINQCLEISRSRLLKNEIELRLPEFKKPLRFKGRDVQISQVLINLISNAIDATKNVAEKWIQLEYMDGPDYLDILVRDSGPGVRAEIKNRIMEPFFTTKEVNQGTGLGLSISKSIMLSHGGELTLLEGSPTTFRMRLPKKG